MRYKFHKSNISFCSLSVLNSVNNIDLGNVNFNEDDPEIIIYVKLTA